MKVKFKITAALIVSVCILFCGCTQSPDSKVPSEAATVVSETIASSESETTAFTESDEEASRQLYQNHTISNGYSRALDPWENDRTVVHDGKLYAADSTGVFTIAQDGSRSYITNTEALCLATDGKTVLFSRKTYESTSAEDRNYEIRSINVDGSDEKILVTECYNYPKPIMIYDGKVYYNGSDYPNQGLFAADLESGSNEKILDGCVHPLTFGTTFIYIELNTSFDIFGTLKTYNYETGEIKTVSEEKLGHGMEFIDDTVYAFSAQSQGSDRNSLFGYNTKTGEFNEMFSINDARAIQGVFEGYFFYTSSDGIYRVPITGGDSEKIELNEFINVKKSENGPLAYCEDGYYLYHDGIFEKVSSEKKYERTYDYFGKVMIGTNDYDTIEVTVVPE